MRQANLLALGCLAVAGANNVHYKVTEEQLGGLDFSAATGNPLKGLVANPDFDYNPDVTSIDTSMEFCAIGLDKVMLDNPDNVGSEAAFDWSEVEAKLASASASGRHTVLSFHVHWPGQPLRMPRHITQSELPLHWYNDMGGGVTPDYAYEPLLVAMEQFIAEFGRLYNKDPRLAFLHLGLLGFWGEWHTYPLQGLVPDEAKKRISDAFVTAFPDTKLQGRYAGDFADNRKIGLYDGSFGFNTLDGEANGGVENRAWYFWPRVEELGRGDFWHSSPMGGETRPELQHDIFKPSYPARTFEHQDFVEGIQKTHSTYILHGDAFVGDGYSGEELRRAVEGHNRLGYAFIVTEVDVESTPDADMVEVRVSVQQKGIAPFYYPLDLVLSCDGTELVARGVETLIDQGDRGTFGFQNVPASRQCLQSIQVRLSSPVELPGRPIKFAQGNGYVSLEVSMPMLRRRV